ncbi:MAG: ABC transporter permease [Actinomycetaceae bacterium]|nr:ABC transporter permease [Actinomycetaceae bacterium]
MLGLVAKREIHVLLRSRPMRIMTIILVVIILAAGFVAKYFLDKNDAEGGSLFSANGVYVIGVEESAASVLPLINAIDPNVSGVEIGDGQTKAWLEEQIAADVDDAYYATLSGTPESPLVTYPNLDTIMNGMESHIETVVMIWRADAVAGPLDADAASFIGEELSPFATKILNIGSDGNLMMTNPKGYMVSIVVLMLLVLAVMAGLTTITTGVVEEKTSRVVEILLTTIKPKTLLLGKILGIGTFILGQFLVFILTAIVALNIAGVWTDLGLSSTIVWTVVWTVLGFFIFAMIAGALASTVSRQEDLGAISTPMSFFALVPLYLGMFLVPLQPDGIWTKIFSYVPFFSSFMMPVRSSYNAVSNGEQLVAAAIALVSIPLLAIVAGKIYENSILRTGKRLSLKEALRGG